MGRSLFLVGLPAAACVVTAGLAFLGDLAPVAGVDTAALVATGSCSSGVVTADSDLAFLGDLAPVTGVVTVVVVVIGTCLYEL